MQEKSPLDINRAPIAIRLLLHHCVLSNARNKTSHKWAEGKIVAYEKVRVWERTFAILLLRKAKRTLQIFIVATGNFCFFQLPHTADFYRCQRQFLKCSSVKHSSRAAWELYFRPILCSSIGLASHVVHDFCRETPHTADFCL